MARTFTLGILSDVHYASAAEQARGNDFEIGAIRNPLLRQVARFYRHYIWLRNPMLQNHLLDAFMEGDGRWDYVIANGDYSCDSACVGVSDDAACASVSECLGKLRQKFGERFVANFGDHELGKLSFFDGRGGMRLASWHRATGELRLRPFWQVELGNYVLLGVVSSLIALPVFAADTVPDERPEWERLRSEHLRDIGNAFRALKPQQRVLLFCHDPTALPFLAEEPAVSERLCQIEQTIIGHLHSNLVLWKSRFLAGMPRIHFLGHSAKRMSSALRQARTWRPFHVRLCPSLAGVELLKDGGYLTVELDPEAKRPAHFRFHSLPRKKSHIPSSE